MSPSRETSPSCNEGESDAESEATQKSPARDTSRAYRPSPAEFDSCLYRPCGSGSTELWLIKAPSGFNPHSFTGLQVPLLGLSSLHTPEGGDGYKVLSRQANVPLMHLLTTNQHQHLRCAPALSGFINISQSFGEGPGNVSPSSVPTRPVPSVPKGLKQRFQPSGSVSTDSKRRREQQREEPRRKKKHKSRKGMDDPETSVTKKERDVVKRV